MELASLKYDFLPLYATCEKMLPQAISGHTKQFQVVYDAILSAQGAYVYSLL